MGPLLFIICISDLGCDPASDISKFAGDARIGELVGSDSDPSILQVELYEWYNKRMVDFSFDKCNLLSVGRK